MRLAAGLLVLVLGVFALGTNAGIFTAHSRGKFGSVPLPAKTSNAPVTVEWFDQIMDHESDDKSTWPQRIMYSNTFSSNPTSPVYLYIGSEGELSQRWLTGGLMFEAARDHGARMLAVEHRFYGQSNPVPDFSPENLRLLSSRQALADLEYVIKTYKLNGESLMNVPIVVFGGSYGGSLSAWARLKFPNLIVGSLASSAPLEPSVEFTKYYEVVERSLRHYGGDKCVDNIRSAFESVAFKLRRPKGPQELKKDFRLCKRAAAYYSPSFEISSFYYAITDHLADIVQYNAEKAELSTQVVCDLLADAKLPYDGLTEVIQRWLLRAGLPCLEGTYDEMLATMNQTVIAEATGMRQWMWQSCTEFGFFQVTGTALAPADAVSPALFYKLCEDAYGIVDGKNFVNAAANETRKFYGGYDFESSNVYFTNGDIDPWSALSQLPETAPADAEYKTLVTAGTSHCAILGTSTASTLSTDRRTVINEVAKWVASSKAPAVVSEDLLRSLKL
jgi:pimeloyl-ACP methyl ester carboxylesterase